jgi:hypothetical protein
MCFGQKSFKFCQFLSNIRVPAVLTNRTYRSEFSDLVNYTLHWDSTSFGCSGPCFVSIWTQVAQHPYENAKRMTVLHHPTPKNVQKNYKTTRPSTHRRPTTEMAHLKNHYLGWLGVWRPLKIMTQATNYKENKKHEYKSTSLKNQGPR